MRSARKRSIADTYHIIARGSGRQSIFEGDDDCGLLHALLRKYFRKETVSVYAWCFMGNHIHLLLHAPLEYISLSLKEALSTYALAFNHKYDRVGHLFQERFKSEPINDDRYLLTVVRYIHQNPVKAGLTKNCDYPWSSFREYSEASNLEPLCDTRPILAYFQNYDSFGSFHEMLDFNCHCLEATGAGLFERGKTRAMANQDARDIAETLLGVGAVESLKSWPRRKRNDGIVSLGNAGLTVRQIERLTGIGRGIIQYELKKAKIRDEQPRDLSQNPT